MKNITLIIIFALIMVSCGNPNGTSEKKDTMVLNGDTLNAVYEPHVVTSCERKKPASIHEEMIPTFIVKLDDGNTFESRDTYVIGDTVIYTIYKK